MPSLSLRRIAAVATVAAAMVAPLRADAVGTRVFELDTIERLSGGELDGTSVASDGTVRAGLVLGEAPIPDATAVFAATRLRDGSVLLGTTPNGKVFRGRGAQLTAFADTKELAVTSIVEWNGGVYASTIPHGKIFRLSEGKAEVFVTVPSAEHVWALAVDAKGSGLYAAVGPDGRVLHITRGGATSVHFKAPEGDVVALAVAPNGDVLAGTSGKGRVYRITGPGRATVLYESKGQEIRAIRAHRDHVLVIANEYKSLPEPPKQGAAAGQTPPTPTSGARPKAGKGELVRIDSRGVAEELMSHDDTHYMALHVDEAGIAYVGAGAEGRVYAADENHVVRVVADTSERQAAALLIEGDSGFVATSDPAVFRPVLRRGGPDSVWTSSAFDCGLPARFGNLSWGGTGVLELSTRTGNTKEPDSSWSAWSEPMTTSSLIRSPRGRFIQVRARWSRDPRAVLSAVRVPFVTENARAIVTSVQASPKGAPESEPGKRSIVESGGAPPKHDAVYKVSWKVENGDADPLRYRVHFQREGQSQWRDANRSPDPLTKSELEWDTSTLPEGRYRVRVEASDESANAPSEVLRHSLVSEPLVVDNTAPSIIGLTLEGRKLRARVVDGTSAIARIELAIDGSTDFRPLAAADGIFDSREERIDADVTGLVPPGSHVVIVRATDSAGNSVLRDVESR